MHKEKPRIKIQFIPIEANQGEKNIEKFKEMFSGIINIRGNDSFEIFPLHNYGNGREYRIFTVKDIYKVCSNPWRITNILFDGRVVPCCMDFNGAMVMGDLNKQTLKEIWSGSAYVKLRNNFIKLQYKEYAPCANCPYARKRAVSLKNNFPEYRKR